MGSINYGNQQITTHYLQSIQSITANQQITDIVEPGILSLGISALLNTGVANVTIESGTCFVFGGNILEEGITRKFITKITFSETTTIPVNISGKTSGPIHIFAVWRYTTDLTQIFVSLEASNTLTDELLYHTSSDASYAKLRICTLRSNDSFSTFSLWTDNIKSLDLYKQQYEKANSFKVMLNNDKNALIVVSGSKFIQGQLIYIPSLSTNDLDTYSTSSLSYLNSSYSSTKNIRWTELPVNNISSGYQVALLLLQPNLIGSAIGYNLIWALATCNNITNWKSDISSLRFDTIDRESIVLGLFWRLNGVSVLSPSQSIFQDQLFSDTITGLFSKDITIPILQTE